MTDDRALRMGGAAIAAGFFVAVALGVYWLTGRAPIRSRLTRWPLGLVLGIGCGVLALGFAVEPTYGLVPHVAGGSLGVVTWLSWFLAPSLVVRWYRLRRGVQP